VSGDLVLLSSLATRLAPAGDADENQMTKDEIMLTLINYFFLTASYFSAVTEDGSINCSTIGLGYFYLSDAHSDGFSKCRWKLSLPQLHISVWWQH
jgi:hypothetical protein